MREYFVETSDGYHLRIYRIPGRLGEGIKGELAGRKAPVFFQHGLFDSSDAWVINGPGQAPAFLAVDAGYDVWLGNFRGNKYSMKHRSLDPHADAEQFYDFDISHHQRIDLVTMVDYVKA